MEGYENVNILSLQECLVSRRIGLLFIEKKKKIAGPEGPAGMTCKARLIRLALAAVWVETQTYQPCRVTRRGISDFSTNFQCRLFAGSLANAEA